MTNAPGLRNDGTRLVGSSLALAWPPIWLQPPINTTLTPTDESTNQYGGFPDEDELYSIRQDCTVILHLLKSADKQPLGFRVPGNDDGFRDLCPRTLDSRNTPGTPFLRLASNLTNLHASLTLTSIRLTPTLSFPGPSSGAQTH